MSDDKTRNVASKNGPSAAAANVRCAQRRSRLSAIAILATGVACGPSVLAADDAAAQKRLHRFVSPSGNDRGDGTRSQRWRTVAHAAAEARPGMTVHVASGRYVGPVTIARGGTADRTVRFVSQRKWRARITAQASGPVAVVELRGDHIRFEGFDVSGTGAGGTAGIDVEGSHSAVVGNHVHDIAVPCPQHGSGGAGIVVGGGIANYRNADVLVSTQRSEEHRHGPA